MSLLQRAFRTSPSFISWVYTEDFLSCYPQDAHFYFNCSILNCKTKFILVCSKASEPPFLDLNIGLLTYTPNGKKLVQLYLILSKYLSCNMTVHVFLSILYPTRPAKILHPLNILIFNNQHTHTFTCIHMLQIHT